MVNVFRWIGAVLLPVPTMAVVKIVFLISNRLTYGYVKGDFVDLIALHILCPLLECASVPVVSFFLAPSRKFTAALWVSIAYLAIVLFATIYLWTNYENGFSVSGLIHLIAGISGFIAGILFMRSEEERD